ncbi:hypothetical protein ES705_07312 [subsurface metagenome]
MVRQRIFSEGLKWEYLRKPATYRETFEILEEERIISEELANELSDLAGFRNVLVHIYWERDLT